MIQYGDTRNGSPGGSGQATPLALNLIGIEIVGVPFVVCEIRVSRALGPRGATLPADGIGIYLTDTLWSPHAEPPKALGQQESPYDE